MRDVIVIGAGGGGPIVAKELAARGLDVLLLEAGAHDNSDTQWSHFEADAAGANGFQRWGPANRAQAPWRRELPQNSFLSQVAGVGGTTRHYWANSPRSMPGVFSGHGGKDKDSYDRKHRFPFPYRELVPYYEWVEATLPVQTAPMGTKDEIFFAAAQSIGLPVQKGKDIVRDSFRPEENAILQPSGNAGRITGIANPSDARDPLAFPNAQGCTFCGHCATGCYMPVRAPRNLKAKRSTYNSYVPMALTADLWSRGGRAITLIADAFAVQVHTEENSQGTLARAVTWRRGADGARFTEEARVIVMAGGAVETPRLWLNSQLPNPNDWVGRGFTDHAPDAVIGVMPFSVKASHGPGAAARADFPGRGFLHLSNLTPGQSAGIGANISQAGMAGLYTNGVEDTSTADSTGRLVGLALKNAFSDIDRLFALSVLTDDDVEAQNRVMLSDTAPIDEHGRIPRLVLHPRNRSARTQANREWMVAKAVELVRAAGAIHVHRTNLAPVVSHPMSSMRMGLSAANSVLTSNAEARWVKRLFIADNSVLANSLGGVNPTLTTQALATRTAEHIFQMYFGGAPWVHKEAPISSIAASVTHAVMQRGL
jgi:choline dehydrogenase-like flavoprotein